MKMTRLLSVTLGLIAVIGISQFTFAGPFNGNGPVRQKAATVRQGGGGTGDTASAAVCSDTCKTCKTMGGQCSVKTVASSCVATCNGTYVSIPGTPGGSSPDQPQPEQPANPCEESCDTCTNAGGSCDDSYESNATCKAVCKAHR